MLPPQPQLAALSVRTATATIGNSRSVDQIATQGPTEFNAELTGAT